MIDLLAWAVFAASLIGMAAVVGRKLPQLRLLDTATIPEEQEAQVKKQIMITRLERKAAAVAGRLRRLLRPVASRVKTGASHLYRKVLDLEEELRNPPPADDAAEPPLTIERLLQAAENLAHEGRYAEAEEKYIAVVERDHLNLAAYRGLGALYLKRREYRLAEEAYRYVLKLLKSKKFASLNPDVDLDHLLATAYAELGSVVEAREGMAAAGVHYRKAAALEPSNPRYLDVLLKISILGKDKTLAQATLQRLREADPLNAKLVTLQAEVDSLLAADPPSNPPSAPPSPPPVRRRTSPR